MFQLRPGKGEDDLNFFVRERQEVGRNLPPNQGAGSPSIQEIEQIYRNFDQSEHLSQKYIERYPMDLYEQEMSLKRKLSQQKKDEIMPEMFYLDVETFKKLYVQNRVLEMKRESRNYKNIDVYF